MKQKQIIVIFEGHDKAGKTTLRHALNERIGYKYMVLDRFTTSSKVYDQYYNRCGYRYYDRMERALAKKFSVLVVLCSAEPADVIARLNAAGETLPDELCNIKEVDKCFHDMLYRGHFENSLHLNTTKISVHWCVEEIIGRLKRMEEASLCSASK